MASRPIERERDDSNCTAIVEGNDGVGRGAGASAIAGRLPWYEVVMGGSSSTSDLGALLTQLDDELARIADAIPWADRDGNRVVFGRCDVADAVAPPTGWEELFDAVVEIRMADVDVGWFVHPPERGSPGEFVPQVVEGVGGCVPLGSDGGGAWLIVAEIDGVHALWHLPDGRVVDGVVQITPGTAPTLVARSPGEFVEAMLVRARAAGRDG